MNLYLIFYKKPTFLVNLNTTVIETD